MATIQPGSRVIVKKILFAESSQHKEHYNHLIGEVGWVAKTDGHLFEVILDGFAEEGYKVFFAEELHPIETLSTFSAISSNIGSSSILFQGGTMPVVSSGITFREVLKRRDMTPYEKLVYIVVHEFAPVDREFLVNCLDISGEVIQGALLRLVSKGMVATGVSDNSNLFWPCFSIQVGSPAAKKEPEKKKEKVEAETTALISDEAKILLFVQQIEKYYKQRGVNYHVSSKGRKYIKKAISYLEKIWEKRDECPEIYSYETLSNLFFSYIVYTFKNLVDNELNHLKRLTFAATKAGWRAMTKNAMNHFEPYLLERLFTDRLYFGLPKNEIPKDPVDSGYHTTLQAFLFSKLKVGNYPLSPQVLYALESYIAYKLFRKQDITDIKAIHKKYLAEYKLAEARDKLDNIQEYVNQNRKKSDYCHDCSAKTECNLTTRGNIVEKCSEKV